FEVRDLMWRYVGLLRTEATLARAVDQLEQWSAAAENAGRDRREDPELRRVSSLALVGLLAARAALRRQESRGAHFRTDFPAHDDIHWRKHVSDVLAAEG